LSDCIAVIKRDGRIEEVNTRFSSLMEKGKEELKGKDYHAVEVLGALDEGILRCIAGKGEQAERINFRGLDLSASIMPITADGELSRVSVILRDISDSVRVENELLKRNRELMIINTLSTAFISSGDAELVFGDLLEKTLMVTDFGIGWIVTAEEGEYTLKCASGVSIDFGNKLRDGRLNRLYDAILKMDVPLYVAEGEKLEEDLRKDGVVFLSAVPLRLGKEAVGLLMLASRAEVAFDFDTASLLSLVGNNLALITDKIRLFQKTERLAITDSLTGLYNARFFYNALNSEISRTERYSTPFSLLIFDVDNFKRLNDTYGHQAGDEVLQALSAILGATVRKSDMAARYGGEEFVAILPNTMKDEAFNLAVRIKEAVEISSFLGQAVRVTLSGGVATFPEDASDAKGLLYAADAAMYEAKAAGKMRIHCYRKKNEARIQKT